MVPSKYQRAVYQWVREGHGSAFVDAVAGSGKTTTALEAAKLIPASSKARFLAFNKSVAEELGGRLKGTPMTASTIHSLGFAALRGRGRFTTSASRYRARCASFLDHMVENHEDKEMRTLLAEVYPVTALTALVDKCRVTLTDPNNAWALRELIFRFGIDVPSELMDFVVRAMPRVIQTTLEATRGEIDFTDMIYLPVVDPSVTVPKYDWLFVDESQDLSPCQLQLVLASSAPGGRMLFVGDPYQAIYGFAGADSESVARIIEKTQATVLPLSVCYRCPSSHLDWARVLVPHIEARDGAVAGEVRGIDSSDLWSHVDPAREDLVICRFNAPLVSMCLSLLANGVPARMRGRDIGATLVAFAEKAQKFSKTKLTTENLTDVLSAYVDHEVNRLLVHNHGDMDDSRIAAIRDKEAAVIAVWTGRECASVPTLRSAVEALFSDSEGGVVSLSSIHRAKGLEANRVFLLHPEEMPRRAGKAWEAQQEKNLLYVALTRAKSELVFVFNEECGSYKGTDAAFAESLSKVPLVRDGVEASTPFPEGHAVDDSAPTIPMRARDFDRVLGAADSDRQKLVDAQAQFASVTGTLVEGCE